VLGPFPLGRTSRQLIFGAGLATTHILTAYARISAIAIGDHLDTPEAAVYVPRPELLRVTSLGHTELLADLLWIRSTIYFGEMFRHPTRDSTRRLELFLDTLLTLDPQFQRVYRWAGTMFIYRTGAVTRADVMRAIRFLERGTRAFPRDWELWFMLGTNYLFELRPVDDAERSKFRRLAADAIARAADLEGRPHWVPTLAATLFEKEGSVLSAIQLLERTIVLTPEDKREPLYGQLVRLRSTEAALRIERETKEFESGWQKTFPYLSAELYIQVGRPERLRSPRELAEPTITSIEDLP
jgi:hypothetical protein